MFEAGTFMSAKGNACVKCALKSNDGLLYPLGKSFCFIHKPATMIKYSVGAAGVLCV